MWMNNCNREYVEFSMLVNDYSDNTGASEHENEESEEEHDAPLDLVSVEDAKCRK